MVPTLLFLALWATSAPPTAETAAQAGHARPERASGGADACPAADLEALRASLGADPNRGFPIAPLRGSWRVLRPLVPPHTAPTPRKPLHGLRRAFVGAGVAHASPAERAPTRRRHTDGQGP